MYNPVRSHESDDGSGDIHFHDDTAGTKCAIAFVEYQSLYYEVGREVKNRVSNSLNNEVEKKLRGKIDFVIEDQVLARVYLELEICS